MKITVSSFVFVILLAAGTYGFAAGSGDETNRSIKELTRQTKALEPRAERPQEHAVLAADYRQLAQLQRDESIRLDERAAWYAQFPIYKSEKFKRATIDTSLYFASKYRTDAQKSEDLATRHERLAG